MESIIVGFTTIIIFFHLRYISLRIKRVKYNSYADLVLRYGDPPPADSISVKIKIFFPSITSFYARSSLLTSLPQCQRMFSTLTFQGLKHRNSYLEAKGNDYT